MNQLFESGIDLLHFRKPESSQADCEKLLKTIPEKWYSRIVIHDHFELCMKYHLHGIRLNHRDQSNSTNFTGSISRSVPFSG